MNLQVGVKVLLKNKDNKYLLVKRSFPKYGKTSGSWDIVGGRINTGTLLIDNLKREVKEETDLEILSEPKLVYAQDIIPDQKNHIVRLTFTAETEGTPTLDLNENIEYKWLSLGELKEHKDLDVYLREVLEKNLLR